jgi:hypothetical protein
LRLHRQSDTPAAREIIERATMVLRLLAYLAARPDLEALASIHGSNGAVFSQSTHYVNEGGFVDLARQRARGTVDSALEGAIEKALRLADEQRDRDDERFGRSYANWLSAGSPSSEHVVPIHRGLDHYAAQFLKDKPHRRLLIVLLDGMSWANAVELLQDCERLNFAPLRYRDAKRTPLLAAVPSLTEISRSALFAGKPIKPSETGTAKDPERFSTHPALKKVGIESARLLLRGDVETQSGDLSAKALDLVRSADRLVALVVNALDDQLSGPRQLKVPADFEHIKLLRRLLEVASEGNRAILLIADHGHVLTQRMNSVGHAGDGARYRYLGDSDVTRPNEIVLGKEHAFVRAGKTRVALLSRDSEAYGTPTATGEHGGISLGEIVTPAILIGSEQLRAQVELQEGVDDPELDVTPLASPDWWQFILPAKPAKGTSKTEPKPEPKPEPKKPQIELPFVAPPKPAPVPEPTSRWLERLLSTKAFDGRPAHEIAFFKKVLAPRIALLADLGGKVSAEHFAKRAGVLPRNVGGVVSEMQEWINFDGYAVVEHDPVAKRVELRLDWLESFLQEMG